MAIRADNTSKTTVQYGQSPTFDAVNALQLTVGMLTPHSPCPISRALIPYTPADEAVVCQAFYATKLQSVIMHTIAGHALRT